MSLRFVIILKTTIKIINNKKDNLLFKEVANRLKNKKTKLKGKAITNKTTNFISKGRGGYKGRRGQGGYKGLWFKRRLLCLQRALLKEAVH